MNDHENARERLRRAEEAYAEAVQRELEASDDANRAYAELRRAHAALAALDEVKP